MDERVPDPRRVITVVSGTPRSGTSMMMQMLEAAGLEIHSDGKRAADADNPKGYYELEAMKRLSEDATFLEESIGRVVKVVAPLLRSLPEEFEYRVIFMEREMGEVMASQKEMMERAGQRGSSDSVDQALEHAFRKRIDRVKDWLDDSENVQVCHVSHAQVVDSPNEASADVADFLEKTGAIAPGSWTGDEKQRVRSRMAEVVDQALYRQRRRSD